MKIAVDAMGGDCGSFPIVEGVKLFIQDTDDTEIILVGEKDRIKEHLTSSDLENGRIEIVDAKGNVDMHIAPSEAIKTKKDSSISIGIKLHREGKADAFISTGNTGVIMAFALITLGRLKNIKRPALACFLPSMKKPILLIDVGANVDCKPLNIYQFGIMGSVYYSNLLDKKKPVIGLLSIGEEPTKGNEQTLSAYKLFKNSSLNFVGNVEGNDILSGETNVIVTDGFVGNVLIKFGESVFELIMKVAGSSINISPDIRNKFSADEYGGAPLLGINGFVFICHGKSSPIAIKNSLHSVRKTYHKDINKIIKNIVSEFVK